jgi:hypothetical protein
MASRWLIPRHEPFDLATRSACSAAHRATGCAPAERHLASVSRDRRLTEQLGQPIGVELAFGSAPHRRPHEPPIAVSRKLGDHGAAVAWGRAERRPEVRRSGVQRHEVVRAPPACLVVIRPPLGRIVGTLTRCGLPHSRRFPRHALTVSMDSSTNPTSPNFLRVGEAALAIFGRNTSGNRARIVRLCDHGEFAAIRVGDRARTSASLESRRSALVMCGCRRSSRDPPSNRRSRSPTASWRRSSSVAWPSGCGT